MMRLLVRAAALTLVLGATVGIVWTAVGGVVAWQGGVARVVAESGLLLYGAIAAAAAATAFALVRTTWRDVAALELAGVVALAWLGEALVLAMLGHRIADEMATDPELAWHLWLVATGFGIQPLAALAGGLAALRAGSSGRRVAEDLRG